MGSTADSAQIGAASPQRDESWEKETSTEVVRSLAEIERSTLLSNLVGTILLVAISQLLPNAGDFLLPAAVRLAAIAATAFLYAEIRNRLERRLDIFPAFHVCSVAGVLAGTSWALLLAPVFIEPVLHPAAFIVAAGVLVAVSIVASTTASLLQSWIPFGVSFLGVFWIRMLEAPPGFALGISVGVGLLYAAVASYSLGAARQRKLAAEMLVENRRLGEELAEALAHAEFLAYRDPLTGMSNRRAFFEQAAVERAPDVLQHVIIIDIDLFKQVNDRFGHDTGDRMLISIAECLRDLLRALPSDGHHAARLGGEEFAILLNISEEAEADRVAELIRTSIAATAQEYSLPAGIGTASIGITSISHEESMSDALRRADKALYEVKEAGRGTVRRINS